MGVSSENAAHRIAVTWDVAGERRTGVFIPRRDSSSLINQIGGGRIFPGTQHHASFESRENDDHFFVRIDSRDGSTHVRVDGYIAADLPGDSIFSSVADVSGFFESGSLGYSPRASQADFDGLELRTFNWHVDPLAINHVESSYFEDRSVFPVGSVTFDNALLMRGINHEWHIREWLCCAAAD